MRLWQSELWLSVLVGVVLVSVSGCASSSQQQSTTGSLSQNKVEVGGEIQGLQGETTAGNEDLAKQLDTRERHAGRIGQEDQMAHLRRQLMEAQAIPLVHF